MAQQVDGYLRIGATDAPPRHFGEAANHLVFVDVELTSADQAERIADQIRRAPRGYFLHNPVTMIRWPDGIDLNHEALDTVASQLALFAQREKAEVILAGVQFRVSQEPEVLWYAEEPTESKAELLAAARAVELDALLEWGKAIWWPPGYHYKLASGEHTDVFIRLADAIRSPRDAVVLATWLYAYASPETSIILDSSTIVPVVLALREAMTSVGAELGPVASMDEYPETLHEFKDLVARVGGAGTLALVSVSSTGRTCRDLAKALNSRHGGGHWRLEPLFRRTGLGATRYDHLGERTGMGEAWCAKDIGSSFDNEDDCDFCHGRTKRPYVGIDPHTFATIVLPDQPRVVTPHVQHDHGELLEIYDRCDAIGIECAPPKRTELRRGNDLSAIRFYPHELLKDEAFFPLARARLQEMVAMASGRAQDGWCDPDLLKGYDALAFLDEDDTPGFERLLGELEAVLDPAPTLVRASFSSSRFDENGDDRDAPLHELLEPCKRILVVTIGAVTGGTMQELLWRVHDAKRGAPKGSYRISGIAAHARPETFREWESLRHAYGEGLCALWVTYLPWRSVLDDEFRLLQQVDPEGVFDGHRRTYCKPTTSEWRTRIDRARRFPELPNPHLLFWGIDPLVTDEELPQLLATSRFGHEVGPIAAFVGIGAAMQRARLENRPKGAPPWLHFEMAAMTSSYFDTLLLVSALRWIEPYEGYWQAESQTVGQILNAIWHRLDGAREREKQVLLPELLLAAAQAKLPRDAESWLRARVEEVRHQWEGPALDALMLGERLLSLAFGSYENSYPAEQRELESSEGLG